ncbi:unnamed protein product [Adineta ricciae]|uniref:F-box domain-containing protein n=1 Tax=Adineta ricciae TaxID=249248 RepID=A0A815A769_ADIRI|nr:unnamed protein product [Adineta ricciae]
MSSFHTLPIDLVYRILDQIESTSIFLARVVCKRSDIIINSHHSYQKSLDYPVLRHLSRLQNNTTVTALELSHNVLGTDGAYYLATFSQNNKVSFHISNYRSHFSAFTLIPLNLNLAWNDPSADSIRYLDNALQNNAASATFFISRANKISFQATQYLCNVLKKNSTIISLIYYFNGIHEQGAQYFGDVLRHNTTLTSLNIGSNNIDDDSIQHLANGLETNSVQYVLLIFQHHVDIQILTTLILCKNKFGHQGFEFLSIALRNNETLNTLDFRANRSFNDDAQYLTNALHANTALVVLELSCTSFSDKGARYLNEALAYNTSGCSRLVNHLVPLSLIQILITLSLWHNAIEAEYAQYLADALEVNKISYFQYCYGIRH